MRADALERAEDGARRLADASTDEVLADQAWRARAVGLTWDAAAEVAGFANAANAIRAVRRIYGTLPKMEREHLRDIWRDRLDWLWSETVNQVEDRKPGALTAGVRVAQAAAALDGLNEPARLSVTPSDSELQAFVADVLAAQGGAALPQEGDIFDVEFVESDDGT